MLSDEPLDRMAKLFSVYLLLRQEALGPEVAIPVPSSLPFYMALASGQQPQNPDLKQDGVLWAPCLFHGPLNFVLFFFLPGGGGTGART